MTSIVEMVRHYQRSIEKSLENPARLLHCVEKLNKLPITVEHLQETGVGKTVNNLRKYDGEVGYASKALVTKWKTMVAKEEADNDSPEEETAMQEECPENDEEEDHQQDIDDDDEEENQLQIDETENIEPVVQDPDDYQATSDKNHHKKSSKHSKHKHSSSSSSSKHSHKDRDRKESSGSRKESSSSSKKHKEDRSAEEKKSKETKTKSHHSSSNKDVEKSSKSDSYSSKKSASSPSKKSESRKKSSKDKSEDGKKRKREQNEFQIDSTMGASFADALGMLDMPSSSKTKKHLEKPSTSAAVTTTAAAPPPAPSSSSKKPSTSASSSGSQVSTKKLMAEPELLSKRPKLEPLLDLVADLPAAAPAFTISNNYKPMPLNQTVMDCVFNQASRPQMRQMTDEEALTYSIMSNKSRTKVYSGVKAKGGKVESLFDSCIRVLQDHIDYLEFTGGVPFDILRPVLEKASYEQLMTLEDFNPYLIEDSDCLWEQHCKRRFRGKCPEEMESWREMFLRCLDEEQAKFKNLTANIKLARDKKLPVRKTKLAYVDSTVKAPRGIKSRQMKYGTDTLPNVTPASRVESLKHLGGNTASIGDRRLKIAAELRNSIPTHGPRINPNKKAPLMAKTLISMKKVFKR